MCFILASTKLAVAVDEKRFLGAFFVQTSSQSSIVEFFNEQKSFTYMYLFNTDG